MLIRKRVELLEESVANHSTLYVSSQGGSHGAVGK